MDLVVDGGGFRAWWGCQAVRIETADGHDRLVLTPLDRLDEPPTLLALRAAIDDRRMLLRRTAV